MSELRLLLESHATSVAATRVSHEELATLRERFEALKAKGAEKNFDEFLALDDLFHGMVYRVADNPFVTDILQNLRAQIHWVRITNASLPGRVEESLHEMDRVLRAMEHRDPIGAAEAMRQHIGNIALSYGAVPRGAGASRECSLSSSEPWQLGSGRRSRAVPQAVQVGPLLFMSGQGPLSPVTNQPIGAGFAEQVQQTFDNVEAILQAAGLNLEHVVKVTVYLADIGRVPEFNLLDERLMPKPYPARTLVQVGLRGHRGRDGRDRGSPWDRSIRQSNLGRVRCSSSAPTSAAPSPTSSPSSSRRGARSPRRS